MRDRRDYVIAGLVLGLVFCLGALVGGGSILPSASAQGGGTGFDPEQPAVSKPHDPLGGGGGVTINPERPGIRPTGFESRSNAPTASDSDSNNRFVAVTSPVGSGESVLFLIDSKNDQLVVYRYHRRKGLMFLAGRKIDYDLKISGYEDHSAYPRDKIRREYEKQLARAAAKKAKNGSGG